MIRKINILAIFLLLSFGNIYSQKKLAASELQKIRAAYLSAVNFSAEVRVTAFKTATQKTGDPMGIGIIRKSKRGYYSKYLSDEMISNDHCTVIVDDLNKNITYIESGTNYFSSEFIRTMPSTDSLLKGTDSVMYKGIENTNQHFIFKCKSSPLQSIDMYVDSKSHFIKKLTYYYAPSNRENSYDMYKIEIVYDNISQNTVDNSWFSENKILSCKKGKPVLQSSYSSYKLSIAESYKKHPLK